MKSHPWNEIITKNKVIWQLRGMSARGNSSEATRRRSGTQTDERMTGAEKNGDLGRPGDKH